MCLAISLYVAATLLVASGGAAAEVREWTGANGFTIQAKFVRVHRGNTVLMRGNRVITVPFQSLSAADQQYIREELQRQGKEHLLNESPLAPEPKSKVSPQSGNDEDAGVPPGLPAPPKSTPGERVWIDMQGRRITATFLRVEGENAVLLKGGTEVVVSLGRLCPADQDYVRAQARRDAPDIPPLPEDSPPDGSDAKVASLSSKTPVSAPSLTKKLKRIATDDPADSFGGPPSAEDGNAPKALARPEKPVTHQPSAPAAPIVPAAPPETAAESGSVQVVGLVGLVVLSPVLAFLAWMIVKQKGQGLLGGSSAGTASQGERKGESREARRPQVVRPAGTGLFHGFSDSEKRRLSDLSKMALDAETLRRGGATVVFEPGADASLLARLTDEELARVVRIRELMDQADATSGAEAIGLYEEVSRLAPWDEICLMSIGTEHARAERFTEAIVYLERAVQLNPENARVRATLQNVREAAAAATASEVIRIEGRSFPVAEDWDDFVRRILDRHQPCAVRARITQCPKIIWERILAQAGTRCEYVAAGFCRIPVCCCGCGRILASGRYGKFLSEEHFGMKKPACPDCGNEEVFLVWVPPV